MDETGIIFKIPEPLSNDQKEDDYYCSLDSSYCKPKGDVKDDRKKIFNSVCSIKGGTPLCSDSQTFEDFYSTPPPDCSSGVCIESPELDKKDIYNIYDNFILFYGNVPFIKVKNNSSHSVYMCKVESGLLKDDQYLSAVVPKDSNNIGTIVNLSNLEWDSFQCRKIPNGYNISSTVLNNNVTNIMKGRIDVVKRTDDFSQYKCDTLPVVITLLHKKSGNRDQYNPTGKLYLALNQYDTIITF